MGKHKGAGGFERVLGVLTACQFAAGSSDALGAGAGMDGERWVCVGLWRW